MLSKRRKIRITLRQISIYLREYRREIITFFVLSLFGSVVLATKYKIGVFRALYETWGLFFFASTLDFPENDTIFSLIWILFPLLGLVILADGLASFGTALKLNDVRSEEWNLATAKEMDGHIIIVGVGNLGIRIVKRLILEDLYEVVCVDDGKGDDFDRVLLTQEELRFPIIRGDARRENVLIDAGIKRAKSIMILVDDDLTNLKIAHVSKKLNPHIRIIVRMFDDDLAEFVEKSLKNVEVLSTSRLSMNFFIKAIEVAEMETKNFSTTKEEEK